MEKTYAVMDIQSGLTLSGEELLASPRFFEKEAKRFQHLSTRL
jgi:hypothetical protein